MAQRERSLQQIRSAQEYAVSMVHASIRQGDLQPGARISPGELAAKLGVSHIPVREALRELEGEGHVVRIPRRGFFVPELSLDDAEDIYRCRRILENEAHRFAIPQLTDADLAVLQALNDEMELAAERSDYLAFADTNTAFHFTVFERSRSEHLLRFLRYLWGAAERYYFAHLRRGTEMPVLQEGHRRLLKAYQARDVETANRIMDEHRAVTLNAIRDRVREGQAETAAAQEAGSRPSPATGE